MNVDGLTVLYVLTFSERSRLCFFPTLAQLGYRGYVIPHLRTVTPYKRRNHRLQCA